MPSKRICFDTGERRIGLEGWELSQYHRKHAVHVGLRREFQRLLRGQKAARRKGFGPEGISAMDQPIPNEAPPIPVSHLEQDAPVVRIKRCAIVRSRAYRHASRSTS